MRQASLSAALAIMTGSLMLGYADDAQANVVTQSQAFAVSAHNDNASSPIVFNGFDASLGILTEVDIALANADVTGTAQFNLSGGEGGSGYFFQTVEILQPTGVPAVSSQGTAIASFYGGQRFNGVFGLLSQLFTGSLVKSGSALTDYTGTTVEFTAELANLTATVTNCMFGNSCAVGSDVSFSGSLNLTYVYDPAAVTSVPEPAPMTVLFTGLLGLVTIRRLDGSRSEGLASPHDMRLPPSGYARV